MASAKAISENQYDAIIVLANLMEPDGTLNNLSRARMDTAIASFERREAPVLITTGWAYRADSDIIIADAMKRYARETYHIPAVAILVEPHARDTVGDAVFIKKNLVNPHTWNRLLVVTSDYHVARTREIFTFIYGPDYQINVVGSPDDKGNSALEDERRSLEAFHRTFSGIMVGDDAAIYRRMLHAHPFYNGTLNPKF